MAFCPECGTPLDEDPDGGWCPDCEDYFPNEFWDGEDLDEDGVS